VHVGVNEDIRSVQEWWLPRDGITRLERLCICRADRRKSGVERVVCLFCLFGIIIGRGWCTYEVLECLQMEGLTCWEVAVGGSALVRAREQRSVWQRRYGRRRVKKAAASSGGRREASDESLGRRQCGGDKGRAGLLPGQRRNGWVVVVGVR
jgi:hypothetical protein